MLIRSTPSGRGITVCVGIWVSVGTGVTVGLGVDKGAIVCVGEGVGSAKFEV